MSQMPGWASMEKLWGVTVSVELADVKQFHRTVNTKD